MSKLKACPKCNAKVTKIFCVCGQEYEPDYPAEVQEVLRAAEEFTTKATLSTRDKLYCDLCETVEALKKKEMKDD